MTTSIGSAPKRCYGRPASARSPSLRISLKHFAGSPACCRGRIAPPCDSTTPLAVHRLASKPDSPNPLRNRVPLGEPKPSPSFSTYPPLNTPFAVLRPGCGRITHLCSDFLILGRRGPPKIPPVSGRGLRLLRKPPWLQPSDSAQPPLRRPLARKSEFLDGANGSLAPRNVIGFHLCGCGSTKSGKLLHTLPVRCTHSQC